MNLRVIEDDSDPLPLAELKSRGDQLLRDAKDAAAAAVVASMQPEFFMKGRRYDLFEVERLRGKAWDAAQAWKQVEATLAELLNEVSKSKSSVLRKQK